MLWRHARGNGIRVTLGQTTKLPGDPITITISTSLQTKDSAGNPIVWPYRIPISTLVNGQSIADMTLDVPAGPPGPYQQSVLLSVPVINPPFDLAYQISLAGAASDSSGRPTGSYVVVASAMSDAITVGVVQAGITLLDGSVLHVGDIIDGYLYQGSGSLYPTPVIVTGPVIWLPPPAAIAGDLAYPSSCSALTVNWGMSVGVCWKGVYANPTNGRFGLGPGGVSSIEISGIPMVITEFIQVIDSVNAVARGANVQDLSQPGYVRVVVADTGQALDIAVADFAYSNGVWAATGQYGI